MVAVGSGQGAGSETQLAECACLGSTVAPKSDVPPVANGLFVPLTAPMNFVGSVLVLVVPGAAREAERAVVWVVVAASSRLIRAARTSSNRPRSLWNCCSTSLRKRVNRAWLKTSGCLMTITRRL